MKPRDSSWLFRVARSCRNRTSKKQKLENHAIYRNESFPDQKFSFSLGIFFVAQTHTEIPNFLEMRGLGFFILSVSINKSGAEKFLENKIHECEKGAVGRICPLILDTQYWGHIRMRNRTARFSGFRGVWIFLMDLKWSIEI